MALGSIVIDLLLKTGAFNNDAKLAERRLTDLGNTAKAAGTAIGLAFAGGVALAANSIRNAVDRMDDLSKAAQRAQMPTEQFSQLAYAGELADVAMSDITSSLGKLAKAQASALTGSKEQAAAFNSLGISIAGADGRMRSTRDVFMDFADAFQQHQGSPEIMALGMQLFGRSFQNLIPLMKDGRSGLEAAADEADRLGVTLSTKAGQDAEEFNDNITRLQKSVQGLWQSVAVELMPDLLDFSVLLNSQGFRNGFATIINGAVSAARTLAQFAVTTANVMNFIGEEVAARAHGAASDDIVRLEQEAERIKAGLKKARDRPIEAGVSDIVRGAVGLPTSAEMRDRLDEIRGQIADFYANPPKPPLVAPAFEPVSLDAGAGLVLGGGGKDNSKAAAKAAADALRELERAQEAAAKQARDFTEAQDDARAMLEDMRAEAEGPAAVALLKYSRMEQDLGLLMAENVLTFTEYADAMELVHQAREKDIAGLEKQAEKTEDTMAVFAEQAQRNMQTYLGDSLYKGLSGSFDGIADAFSDMIKRMTAELIASQMMKFFMGSGSQGGVADLYGGQMGFATGGYTGPGGRNQPAGVVHKGEVVWSQHDIAKAGGVGVVESMRRGLRGYANGGVVGSSVVAPGVTVNVHNAPPGTEVRQSQAPGGGLQLDVLLKAVKGEVAGDIASGGMVAGAIKGRFGLKEAV